MNDKKWQITDKETVLKTPWFEIEKQQLVTTSGIEATYFVHHKPDSVIAVCLNGAGEVLVERLYRPAVAKVSVDLPAGGIDASDASPEAAMIRELREETGFEVDKIEQLTVLDGDPSFSSARVHVFLAHGEVAAEASPEETEEIAVEFVAPAELLAMVDNGELGCVFCTSAVLLAGRRLGW